MNPTDDDQASSSISRGQASPTLKPGIRVILMPDPATEHASTDAVNTSIAHVDAATGRIIVVWPSVAGEPLPVESGLALLLLIAQPGDGLYSRPFVVENTQRPTGQPEAGQSGWLVLRPVDLWQRIDRRRAERVAVSLAAVRGRRFPASGGSLTIDCVVRDLSVGGLLLELDQRVGLADTLEFALPLDDGQEPVVVRARVQRVQQGSASDVGIWLAGCKFEGLRSPDQARIVSFLAGHHRLGTIDS